jgi:hypothetical protein
MNFSKFLLGITRINIRCLLVAGITTGLSTISFSAFDKVESGALPVSMGNAIVAMTNHPFAVYYNPAALFAGEKFEIALTHQLLFGIKDLSQTDIVINYLISGHPFSFAMSQYGISNYREHQLYFGTKLNITPVCAIGGSVQYYNLAIRHYGQDTAWGINLGLYYSLEHNVKLGFLIRNINRPSISRTKEPLPQSMSMGMSYEPIERLILCIALFRDIRFPPAFRAGFSYPMFSALEIRAGIEDQINSYNFGFGIKLSWVDVDYAVKVHTILGASHIFSIMVTI